MTKLKPKTLSIVLALALLLTQVLGVTSVFAAQKVKSSKSSRTSMNKVMSFSALSVSADVYEPDNTKETANLIASDGTPQTHTITSDFDLDWVKFEATAGQGYKINTSNLLPSYEDDYSMDTALFLYDSAGNFIKYNDDGREGLESEIGFVAEATGTYYVLILHYSDWDWDDGGNIEREDSTDLLGETGQYDIAVSIDNTAPVITSANLYEGDYLELTYDDVLNENSVPESVGFTVYAKSVGSETYEEVPVDSIDIYGTMVGLSLGGHIADDSTVYLNYTLPVVSRVQDICGNDAEAFTEEPVTVEEDTAPELNNATVDGDLVSLYFNQKLDQGSVPAPEYFAVYAETTVGSGVYHEIPVDNVAITGTYKDTVTLTLHDNVAVDSKVYLNYLVPEVNPIQDLGGKKSEALENFEVYNATPDTTAPNVSSTDPENAATGVPVNKTITVTFSEPVWQGANFDEITLKQGSTVVDFTYSISGNNLLIDPVSNLGKSVTYDVYIPAAAVEDDWDNPLTSSYNFSFTTERASGSGGGGGGTTTPTTPPASNGDNTANLPSDAIKTDTKGNVTTVIPDENKVLNILNQNPNTKTVVIPVNANSSVISTQVTGSLLTSLSGKAASIEIQTAKGSYTLPAAEIKVAALAGQLGVKAEDVKINIIIAEPTASQKAAAEKYAKQNGLDLVALPVEFKIEAVAGDKKAEINNFGQYVSRTLTLSRSVNPANAVGVIIGENGEMTSVPTKFTVVNGKTAAVINSKSNSVYTVIENKISFADVNSHWAKEDVNTLASKLIIKGMTASTYAPENKVTRAQFATLLVKALGLKQNASKATFSDVKSSDWYAGAVGAAVDAGIVKGYPEGTFKPNANVTREEAAAMVVQALKAAGAGTNLTAAETEQNLAKFTDGVKISSWAKTIVAQAVQSGIIQGYNNGTFIPGNNSTRAEAAVMIKKMLGKANLI